ncbi:MAG: GTPase Era [Candidatus Melainabacteria bacterium]
MTFHSGFVAIVGRPNVGKSTLLNRLVGQKIAITSPVMQTTRHRIKGVVTTRKGQVVFLDTPGFSKALDKLGNYLTDEASAALSEADALVVVVDGTQPPGKGDAWVISQVLAQAKPANRFVLLLMNKVDRLKSNPQKRAEHRLAYVALFEGYANLQTLLVSARTGKQTDGIADTLLRRLPEGPAYYDEDAVTDQRMREITAELIREQVLHNTQEEIPHSVAVGIDIFDESDPALVKIKATLYVDQESQKGILIGKGGDMIRTIGTGARRDIERMVERSVYLDLKVKLKKNWRKDPQFLKSLGLAPPAVEQ